MAYCIATSADGCSHLHDERTAAQGTLPGPTIPGQPRTLIPRAAAIRGDRDHRRRQPAPQLAQLALIHGYTTVFWCCAGIFAAGAIIWGALLRPGPLTSPEDIPARKPSPQAVPAQS